MSLVHPVGGRLRNSSVPFIVGRSNKQLKAEPNNLVEPKISFNLDQALGFMMGLMIINLDQALGPSRV